MPRIVIVSCVTSAAAPSNAVIQWSVRALRWTGLVTVVMCGRLDGEEAAGRYIVVRVDHYESTRTGEPWCSRNRRVVRRGCSPICSTALATAAPAACTTDRCSLARVSAV